ncbi:glucose-6-phosphate isomerase [Candidatus Endowatersipora endosymbiont of Watersipora subatra]|uniref:glucose-6-phosphate isomerase n=1 Tax=Candidatus Endowatersipora endosymbiont of Watersipora subatra TaxID=3077946 RepID=UPI00312C9B4A
MIKAAKKKLSELQRQYHAIKERRIVSLFEQDKRRFDTFSTQLDNLLFDYSKTNIDLDQLKDLISLARLAKVDLMIENMFTGRLINETEKRAVLHTALRNFSDDSIYVEGYDILPDIKAVRHRMIEFCNGVRNGTIKGGRGKFLDVVNIGIGGSNLGPHMATLALSPFHDGPRIHFVSNVDGMMSILNRVHAGTTLFIIASKSFTTEETMRNANAARCWLINKLGPDAVKDHFVALSTDLDKIIEFGIEQDRIFRFWDWVGGRYSLWSAIGLPVMLSIGVENFQGFLAGARSVDTHFRNTDFEHNIPVLMALIGIWHRNICAYDTYAILPYDRHLSQFPPYLQQLDMESNGKSVSMSGRWVETQTGPVIWGGTGIDGQHTFYQLIHQGTSVVPCDILIAANSNEYFGDDHERLVANALAQSEALMVGKSMNKVKSQLLAKGINTRRSHYLAKHRSFPGNRPTCTFIYPILTPNRLGQLIALYEHKIFVQGVIWDINSFDQWGVELGKEITKKLLPMVKKKYISQRVNSSTGGLLRAFHTMHKKFRS